MHTCHRWSDWENIPEEKSVVATFDIARHSELCEHMHTRVDLLVRKGLKKFNEKQIRWSSVLVVYFSVQWKCHKISQLYSFLNFALWTNSDIYFQSSRCFNTQNKWHLEYPHPISECQFESWLFHFFIQLPSKVFWQIADDGASVYGLPTNIGDFDQAHWFLWSLVLTVEGIWGVSQQA